MHTSRVHDRGRLARQPPSLLEHEADRRTEHRDDIPTGSGRRHPGAVRACGGNGMATQAGQPARDVAPRHTYSQRAVSGVNGRDERDLGFEDEGQGTWPEPPGQPASQRRQCPQPGLHLPKVRRDQRHSNATRPTLQPTQLIHRSLLSRVNREPVQGVCGIRHDPTVGQHLNRGTEYRAGRIVADEHPAGHRRFPALPGHRWRRRYIIWIRLPACASGTSRHGFETSPPEADGAPAGATAASTGRSARGQDQTPIPRAQAQETASCDASLEPALRARARVTAHFRPPIHPAWRRCSSVAYCRHAPASRLALAVRGLSTTPQHGK